MVSVLGRLSALENPRTQGSRDRFLVSRTLGSRILGLRARVVDWLMRWRLR